MVLQIILLIIGFTVLIKGADIFVDGASNLARNFKMSKMLIGLTIVAFGTSAPEFAVSVSSILAGSGDIVIGNIVGSNILNILLILGVSSLIHDLKVKNNTVKKELPMTLLISSLLVVLMSDQLIDHQTNLLSREDGIVL
ncbi:MAG: sodium:calcium antiporter, partial [bacterium]|nr:sodium:calcium antiporter [bacterium]